MIPTGPIFADRLRIPRDGLGPGSVALVTPAEGRAQQFSSVVVKNDVLHL